MNNDWYEKSRKEWQAKTLAEFEALEKEIEAKTERNEQFQKGLNWFMDNYIFNDAFKKWEASKTDPEPKREDFDGAWQKLLNEKTKAHNAEIQKEVDAFEAEVMQGLKDNPITV